MSMDSTAGMVAVVRGLRDAGLAVTLYDNGKQFTLAPNTFSPPTTNQAPNSPLVRMHDGLASHMQQIPHVDTTPHMQNYPMGHMSSMYPMAPRQTVQNMREMPQLRSTSTDVGSDRMEFRCNSGMQAVDGRYASVYQTTVGKVKPTSPPMELTEFPPQRPGPDIRGHGNFVVGGTGSGDTSYSPTRCRNSFRGGLSWSDRGSVFAARPSRQPDAFASSLRRYPRLSPDRSSEIVERLITYTQAKNYGKPTTSRYQNANVQSRSTDQYDDERRGRSPGKGTRGYDPRPRYSEESPTRERPRRYEYESPEGRRSAYGRNYDVRYLKDMSRPRDNVKKPTANSNQHRAAACSRERCETIPETRRSMPEQPPPNMVSSEMQAAAVMVCREVATVPRVDPPKRNVAVSSSREPQPTQEGGVFRSKSIQTPRPTLKPIQTTLSCIEIPSTNFIPTVRKSRSNEEISTDNLEKTFVQKLDKMLKVHEMKHDKDKKEDPNYSAIATTSKMFKSKKLTVWYRDCDDSCRAFRRKVSKDLVNNMKSFENRNFNVFRAEVTSFVNYNDSVRRVISTWLDGIPLKTLDFLGRIVRKEQILSYVVCRIKIIPSRIRINKKRFRSEILDIVDDIPFDISHGNKTIYLNKLVEDLITKLECTKIRSYEERHLRKRNFNEDYIVNTAASLRKYIRPTEDRIRSFVRYELVDSLRKSKLDLDSNKLGEIETDLVDILLDYLDDILIGKDEEAVDEIVILLRDTGQLLKNQATNFAFLLLQKVRKTFMHRMDNECSTRNSVAFNKRRVCGSDIKAVRDKNCGTGALDLIDQICGTATEMHDCHPSYSYEHVPRNLDVDTKTNAEQYKQKLSEAIKEWLDEIENDVVEAKDPTFRYIVVNDLAGDIIDRQKYIELNNGKVSDKEELEHLRYQIFKWINRLVGENNASTLEKAPELMRKIRSIPVPVLTQRSKKRWDVNPNRNPDNLKEPTICEKLIKGVMSPECINQTVNIGMTEMQMVRNPNGNFTADGQAVNIMNQGRLSEPARGTRDMPDAVFNYNRNQAAVSPFVVMQQTIGQTSGNTSRASNAGKTVTPPSAEAIGQDYSNFVNEWVQLIPLPPDIPPDVVEMVRNGLVVGVFRAIAKIKASPSIMINPFHLEDVMDDEIEELYSSIPETPEFTAKRHILKHRLVEKTAQMNELLKMTHVPETFGQQLVDKVVNYVPKPETKLDNENLLLVFEELKILFLTEEYILYLRYRDEDEVKANVYRMKLMRRIQEFVNDLKKTYNAELRDVSSEMYMNEILAAMQQVPLPANETIRQEADAILLGMEVDQWFSDLPLLANDDVLEQLKRRRLRDNLARKLYELEKNISFQDESGDRALRHEVSLVLGKLPLNPNENVRINLMVDELTNRLKNRQRMEYYNASQMPQQMQQGNQWLNAGPPASMPPATRTMTDPTGRTWYSFDEQRQNNFPQQNMHQSLPVGSTAQNTGPAANRPSLAGAARATVPSGPPVGQGPMPQNLQNMFQGPPGLKYVTEFAPPAPATSQGPQLTQQAVPAQSVAMTNASQEGPDQTYWLAGVLEEYEARQRPYGQPDTSMTFAPNATIQDPSMMGGFEPPLSSSMYQPQQNIISGQNMTGQPVSSAPQPGSGGKPDCCKQMSTSLPAPQKSDAKQSQSNAQRQSLPSKPASSRQSATSQPKASSPKQSTAKQSSPKQSTAKLSSSPTKVSSPKRPSSSPTDRASPRESRSQTGQSRQSISQSQAKLGSADSSLPWPFISSTEAVPGTAAGQANSNDTFASMEETKAPMPNCCASSNPQSPNGAWKSMSQPDQQSMGPFQSMFQQGELPQQSMQQNLNRPYQSMPQQSQQPSMMQQNLMHPNQSMPQQSNQPSMMQHSLGGQYQTIPEQSQHQSMMQQNLGAASQMPQQSQRPSMMQQSVGGPRQSLGQQSNQPSLGQSAGPRESLAHKIAEMSGIANNRPPNSLTGDQFKSINETTAPSGLWGSQPIQAPPRQLPDSYQIPSYFLNPPDINSQLHETTGPAPPNQTNASVWLPQMMREFEDAHPSLVPQNEHMVDPQGYDSFGQGRPRSSSMQQSSCCQKQGQAGPNAASPMQTTGPPIAAFPQNVSGQPGQDRRVSIAPHTVVVTHDHDSFSAPSGQSQIPMGQKAPRISLIPVEPLDRSLGAPQDPRMSMTAGGPQRMSMTGGSQDPRTSILQGGPRMSMTQGSPQDPMKSMGAGSPRVSGVGVQDPRLSMTQGGPQMSMTQGSPQDPMMSMGAGSPRVSGVGVQDPRLSMTQGGPQMSMTQGSPQDPMMSMGAGSPRVSGVGVQDPRLSMTQGGPRMSMTQGGQVPGMLMVSGGPNDPRMSIGQGGQRMSMTPGAQQNLGMSMVPGGPQDPRRSIGQGGQRMSVPRETQDSTRPMTAGGLHDPWMSLAAGGQQGNTVGGPQDPRISMGSGGPSMFVSEDPKVSVSRGGQAMPTADGHDPCRACKNAACPRMMAARQQDKTMPMTVGGPQDHKMSMPADGSQYPRMSMSQDPRMDIGGPQDPRISITGTPRGSITPGMGGSPQDPRISMTGAPRMSPTPGIGQMESPGGMVQGMQPGGTVPIASHSSGSYSIPALGSNISYGGVASVTSGESICPNTCPAIRRPAPCTHMPQYYGDPNQESPLASPPPEPSGDVHKDACSLQNTDEEYFLAKTSFPDTPAKTFKSVQTAFSFIDITNIKNKSDNSGEIRKTKSHENVKNTQPQIQDDIIEWLQELYSVHKAKLWSERLARLAQKLRKPGGEEKLRTRIRKFLKKVPSNFSDGDEDGREFREHLPDYIIKKLKKLFQNKNETARNKAKRSPLEFYVVPPTRFDWKQKSKTDLRNIVKNWIKDINIKRRDFLGRSICKIDILNSIVQRLEPFTIYRPESTADYRGMLTSYITEILTEIPLAHKTTNIHTYIKTITKELVDQILTNCNRSNNRVERVKATESLGNLHLEKQNNISKEIEDFVAKKLTDVLEKSKNISRNRMACIQVEIAGILSEAFQSDGGYKDNEMKTDINEILVEVGRLNKYQAKCLTEDLIANYREMIVDYQGNSVKRIGRSYSETYLVYDYEEDTERRSPFRKNFCEKNIDAAIKNYNKQISAQIEHWLSKFKDFIPMAHQQTFREMAVTELVETIVNRHKYLDIHPFSQESIGDECEYLKCLIFKWIRKLAGEDKIEIIQAVPELIRKIRKIAVPNFKSGEEFRSLKCIELPHVPNACIIKELYEEIFDWYYDLPRNLHYHDDRKVKKQYIRKLSENIEKALFTQENIDEVLDKEVDVWARKVVKTMPRSLLLEELKAKLKNICSDAREEKTDASMQVTAAVNNMGTKTDFCIRVAKYPEEDHLNYKRKVTKQIDEWLNDLPLPMYDRALKQTAIRNLASDIVDRQKYIKLNPGVKGTDEDELENLKYQIFKWLNKVVSEDNMETVAHAPELMQRLRKLIPDNEAKENKSTNYVRNYTNQQTSNTNIDNKTSNIVKKSAESIRSHSPRRKTATTSVTGFNVPCSTRGVGGSERGFAGKHGRITHSSNVEIPSCSKKYAEKATEEIDHSPITSDDSDSVQSRRTKIDKALKRTRHTNFCANYSTCSFNNNQGLFGPNSSQQSQEVALTTENVNHTVEFGSNPTEVYTMSRKKKNSLSKKDKKNIKQSIELESRVEALPIGMTLQQTYEYFDKIFQKRCEELPVSDATYEQQTACLIARAQMHNNIWKTYFKLTSDPSIENDFNLFEAMLEDRLDMLLDCLPFRMESNLRQDWKLNVIFEMSRLLVYVHNATDAVCFKQNLCEKFERQFLRLSMKSLPSREQQTVIRNTINAYILYLRFKHSHPIKANAYRQRLMSRLDELAEQVRASLNVDLQHVNRNQFCHEAYRVLSSVVPPERNVLKELANEIFVSEEIGQWFSELPVVLPRTPLDELLRTRKIEALAKKLYNLELKYRPDTERINSAIVHEVHKFLQQFAFSREDNNKYNIDFMIYELANRLSSRRPRHMDENQGGNSIYHAYSEVAMTPLMPVQPYLPAISTRTVPQGLFTSPNTENLFHHYTNNNYMDNRPQCVPGPHDHYAGPEQKDEVGISESQYPAYYHTPSIVPNSYYAAPAFTEHTRTGFRTSTGIRLGHVTINSALNRNTRSTLANTQTQSVNSLNVGQIQPNFPSTPNVTRPVQFSRDDYGKGPNEGRDRRRCGSPVNQMSGPDDENDEIRIRCQCTEKIYRCHRRRNLDTWDPFPLD